MQVSYPKTACTLAPIVSSWKRELTLVCSGRQANRRSFDDTNRKKKNRQVGLPYEHDHFALAPAVEFAKKDALPAAQQQLAVFERHRHA